MIENHTGAKISRSPGNQTADAKALWSQPNRPFGKSELKKMSRPRLTFPKFEGVSTRPDQEVQPITTNRQKELFGRKVANADIRDQKNVRRSNMTLNPDGTFSHGPDTYMDYSQQPLRDKRSGQVSRKFDRNTLGLMSPTKTGPKAAALEGKLRSKYEDGDDEYKQKLEEHKNTRNSLVDKYNNDYRNWQKEAYQISNNKDLKTTAEKQRAWEEITARKPVKPKLPRKPSKPKVDTSSLSPEKQKIRGQTVDPESFPIIKNEPLKKAPMQYEPKVVSSMPIEAPKKSPEIHSVKLPNGLIYKQFRGPNDYKHQLFHPNVSHPVAEVVTSVDDHDDHNSTQDHTITWAQVHPEHKGQGFGKQLYLATLTHGKGVGRVKSDKTTSENAEKTWDHVLSQPGISGKKAPWLKQLDSREDLPMAEIDQAMRGQHQAMVSDKKKLDQSKMFPAVGGSKKLAASEMEKNEAADKETEKIKENKKKPEAKRRHEFKAASWTHPNGHPRCMICGDEERTGGICEGINE